MVINQKKNKKDSQIAKNNSMNTQPQRKNNCELSQQYLIEDNNHPSFFPGY